MGLWYLLRPRGRAKRATAAGDEAAPLPSCGPSAGDIAEFPEDSRRAVFEDRRQGLLILVRRHILDEAEIDDLAARPLGDWCRRHPSLNERPWAEAHQGLSQDCLPRPRLASLTTFSFTVRADSSRTASISHVTRDDTGRRLATTDVIG